MGGGVSQAKIRIRETGGTFSQDLEVNPNGFFNVILNPGSYKVGVEATGYSSEQQEIKVGDSRTPFHPVLKKI